MNGLLCICENNQRVREQIKRERYLQIAASKLEQVVRV